MSVLEKCSWYRGHEYYVTSKAPLMVCSLSQNGPKQVLEVHLNCLMDKSIQYTLQVEKEVEKGKQQLGSLQRLRNLDAKWQ